MCVSVPVTIHVNLLLAHDSRRDGVNQNLQVRSDSLGFAVVGPVQVSLVLRLHMARSVLIACGGHHPEIVNTTSTEQINLMHLGDALDVSASHTR